MIASAIFLVLALLISTLFFNTSRAQKKLEKRSDDSNLTQQTALDIRLHPVPSPSPSP